MTKNEIMREHHKLTLSNEKALAKNWPWDLSVELDIDGLGEEEVRTLKKERAQEMIRLEAKANDLVMENKAMEGTLTTMVDHTARASADGTAVTLTRKIKDTLGETEVIMGNTETARRGKFSRDYNFAYFLVAGVVVVVIVLALVSG
jgi:hypothetical protein